MLRRKKLPRCLMTFPNTTEAMKMEDACRAASLPGRLIPVPGTISAGCGMAWMSELDWREEVEKLARLSDVKWEAIHELDL